LCRSRHSIQRISAPWHCSVRRPGPAEQHAEGLVGVDPVAQHQRALGVLDDEPVAGRPQAGVAVGVERVVDRHVRVFRAAGLAARKTATG
jgi:hypothetical protein